MQFLANVNNIRAKLDEMDNLLVKMREIHHKSLISVGERKLKGFIS